MTGILWLFCLSPFSHSIYYLWKWWNDGIEIAADSYTHTVHTHPATFYVILVRFAFDIVRNKMLDKWIGRVAADA